MSGSSSAPKFLVSSGTRVCWSAPCNVVPSLAFLSSIFNPGRNRLFHFCPRSFSSFPVHSPNQTYSRPIFSIQRCNALFSMSLISSLHNHTGSTSQSNPRAAIHHIFDPSPSPPIPTGRPLPHQSLFPPPPQPSCSLSTSPIHRRTTPSSLKKNKK